MAKPIRATPELKGEDANKFLRKMLEVETSKITFKQKELSKEIIQNMKALRVC
ncbi:MAG: hypothetical protein AABW67_03765 [Nanoarchaeota archaeon]